MTMRMVCLLLVQRNAGEKIISTLLTRVLIGVIHLIEQQ